jgi:alpha-mannosidase
MKTKSTETTGTLFVVSTSHMDWDWGATFEQYYSNGLDGNPPTDSGAVVNILNSAIELINQNSAYKYNLAEVAWLQRYMKDNPRNKVTPAMVNKFYFLGGGITSPDNLICNGEAFIRNYLIGRNYVKSLGLNDLLTDVCWIPDDFGQDPQLPVVLKAMGMTGVSFWRVPGNQPSPPQFIVPTAQQWSTKLATTGGAFKWFAADHSSVLTLQMIDNYGVIWNQVTDGGDTTYLTDFVNQTLNVQPGKLFMAPCSGDFSPVTSGLPDSPLVDAVNYYNSMTPGGASGVNGVMGTFQDWIDAMNNDSTIELTSYHNFDASNFWTGFFSSRVQLKINHQRAVNRLMAAETLVTLLAVKSMFSRSVLDGFTSAIDTAWENLIPSTHHDYIPGTAGDIVYYTEQLPLGETALIQSEEVLKKAMDYLGQTFNDQPQNGEISYAVFNPSGFSRTVGTMIEIEKTEQLKGVNSYRLPNQTTYNALQMAENGNFLLPYEGLASTGYGCVYLSSQAQFSAPVLTPAIAESYTFGNGLVNITIDKSNAWAISSIRAVALNQVNILGDGNLGNDIKVYYEKPDDSNDAEEIVASTTAPGQEPPLLTQTGIGNIYQMGNELYPSTGATDGFYADSTSVFEGQDGEILENGPYRWHFRGTIYNAKNDLTTIVEYFLEFNEPMVRVRITGRATKNRTSPNTVVTGWSVDNVTAMNYGTANHWYDNGNFVPYWNGPTFRPVHDFITLNGADASSNPIAAMYNEGMRSWALTGNQLLGILFRNSPGADRGAAGSDIDVHTQNFAFRINGVGNAASCQPLQESLAFQQRQLNAPVRTTIPLIKTLQDAGSENMLAAVDQSNAIIRVARLQPGSGSIFLDGVGKTTLPFSFILRLYQPTNHTTSTKIKSGPFIVKMPLPPVPSTAYPIISLVTALEESIPNSSINYANGQFTLSSMDTLTTVQVQTFGPTIPCSNGKN